MRTWKRIMSLALAGLLAVPSLGGIAGASTAEAAENEIALGGGVKF